MALQLFPEQEHPVKGRYAVHTYRAQRTGTLAESISQQDVADGCSQDRQQQKGVEGVTK